MRLAIGGDPDAREALYRRTVGPLYRFVFWRVGSRAHVAEEVVQDSFLDAFGSLGSLRRETGFFAWLCGIARRKAGRLHRKEGPPSSPERALSLADPAIERMVAYLAGRGPLPEEALEKDEVRRIVSGCLSAVPPRWQALLRGKYVEEKSADDIARESGESAAAVNSALQRARAAFEAALRAAFGGEDVPIPG